MTMFFAHSGLNPTKDDWQELRDHLLNVFRLAGDRAGKFGTTSMSQVAGALQDLGKFAPALFHQFCAVWVGRPPIQGQRGP